MRYILSDIRLPLDYNDFSLLHAAAKKLRVKPSLLSNLRIERRSVDAREKYDVCYRASVSFDMGENVKTNCPTLRKYSQPPYVFVSKRKLSYQPVVIGSGPAGLFAALTLAKCGSEPILLERGKSIPDRVRDVDLLWGGGKLNTESNVQFGEGGAGTFSDGKLNTGTKDIRQRYILETFVRHGAPEDILIDAKPHIGTDKLRHIVVSLRDEIISMGGEVIFSSRFDRFTAKDGRISSIVYSRDGSEKEIPTKYVVLAIGHSARDTFEYLNSSGIAMERKNFAVGVRIEHLKEHINRIQYGAFASRLPAADYKFNVFLPDGRGVYTFCMCPGGKVVLSSSEEGMIVTNGMSDQARDDINSNSALLINVDERDFLPFEGVLAGMEYQRSLERTSYRLAGSYKAPAARLEDFLKGRETSGFGEVLPSILPGTVMCSLDEILPRRICSGLREAIPLLDRKMQGFMYPDAVLTAAETRSSSPVRITRGESFESVSLRGLYPCGEGAGYAGGIMSAATDGIRYAEAICASVH